LTWSLQEHDYHARKAIHNKGWLYLTRLPCSPLHGKLQHKIIHIAFNVDLEDLKKAKIWLKEHGIIAEITERSMY
jgi:hypothetical protein